MTNPLDPAYPNTKQWSDSAGAVWLPSVGGLTKRELMFTMIAAGLADDKTAVKKIVERALEITDAGIEALSK